MPTDLVLLKGVYDRAGGPETVLQMILGHLDRTQFDPTLALIARPGQAVPQVLQDLTAQTQSARIAWHGIARAPASAAALGRILQGRSGAVLQTNDMRADLLAYLLTRVKRVPWIAHVHGWLGETHAGRWKLYEGVDRWLVRRADLVLVGSTAMANEVRSAGVRRVEIVTNGIPAANPAAYDAEAAAVRRRVAPEGGLIVGMLGRLHPGKGQALLIQAVAQLRDAGTGLTVLLVGEGPAEPEYRALAAELGFADRVHFAGLVPDPLPFLRAMDIVCVPSLKDSLPLTALEAMSVARPVIASMAGDLSLAIDDGRSGVLVPIGSVDALRDAIARLAGGKALRAAMGEAGRVLLEQRFTPAAMLRQFEGFCSEVRG